MSLREPKFGDIFRWKSDTQDSLVMYVAPAGGIVADWVGVTIDEDDFLPTGDVDLRLTLASASWSEVIE